MIHLSLKEIIFQIQEYQEKLVSQGLQKLRYVVRCGKICIKYNFATTILVCTGHFSVEILGNVLFVKIQLTRSN